METLEEKIARVTREQVAIVPYDPGWPEMFAAERRHLLACLPQGMILRVEHIGSTAVPGLAAKPIVDMLVAVADLGETRRVVPPLFEAQGYDYFWRPSWGDDVPPWYAFLIKRDAEGHRTHHIHMLEADSEHWERVLFRDYLIGHPQVAEEYARLKGSLARRFENDRVGYTDAKTAFIRRVTDKAKRYFGGIETTTSV